MDFADYLKRELLLDEEFMDLDDDYFREFDEISTSLACPLYSGCPYVDECNVYSGFVNAVCWLIED